MGLNRLLVLHHLHVVVHLLVRSQDDGLTFFIVLGSTGTTEDLLNIEHSDIFVGTGRGVIDFGSFDDDTVCWQVDTPRQSRCRAQHLDVSLVEHLFD